MKHVRNRDSKQNFKNGYLKRSARFKTVVQSNQNKFKCESEREEKKKKNQYQEEEHISDSINTEREIKYQE